MTGQVNPVDSVKVGTPTPATQPARTVEPEEEQMFEFNSSSALELGYNIGKSALKVATGYGALEVITESTKNPKEYLHETAENIRKFKDEHPVLGYVLTGGVIGSFIPWLDKQINK